MLTHRQTMTYKNTMEWARLFLLSILLSSMAISTSLVHAKSKKTDTRYAQKKLLGQWVYVEADQVKEVIDFFDKDYFLISPYLIKYDNGWTGNHQIIGRWFLSEHPIGMYGGPDHNIDGETILTQGSSLVFVDLQFINRRKTTGLFLKKPYHWWFTVPKDGVMYILVPSKTYNGKPQLELKKLIHIKKLKKTKPDIYAAWELKRKKILSNAVPDRIYSACYNTWKSQKSAFSECLKFKEKYKEYGFAEYKPVIFDRMSAPANKFLLKPITNYSDSTDLPTSLSYEPLLSRCEGPWRAKLEKRGFKDTLWTLKIQSNVIKQAKNESHAELKQYINALVVWANYKIDNNGQFSYLHNIHRQKLVHLRNDGVIGLSWDKDDKVVSNEYSTSLVRGKNNKMIYDPANRWTYDGKNIHLKWQNGLSEYQYGGASGSSPLVKARYEAAFFRLVQSHLMLDSELKYHHFGWRKKTSSTAQKKLEKKVSEEYPIYQRTREISCKAIKVETNPVPKQHAVKMKSPKSDIKIKSSYWHARIVLVDPKTPIDPNIKALWGKGAFLHLRRDGRIGFNWSMPNSYGYDPNNSWVRNKNKLTIRMGGISYTFDISKGGSPYTTVDNNAGTFRMMMQTKSAGQK